MNKKTLIGIIAVAAIILLAAAAFAMNRTTSNDMRNDATVERSDNTTPESSETSEVTDMPIASISYTDAGFSPATLTIQKGTALTITNESSIDLMFASADHPTHEDNAELNLDTIKPGASGTVTLTKTGAWGYHNHDMADHMGQIIVNE
jgi:plastocyanin